jgi:hypothetical protein
MRTTRPQPTHRTRRRVVGAALAATTLATLASVHAAGADSGACTIHAAADGMPLGQELVGTERPTSAGPAILHRVDCPDRPTQWVWIRTSAGTGGGIAVVDPFELQFIGTPPS